MKRTLKGGGVAFLTTTIGIAHYNKKETLSPGRVLLQVLKGAVATIRTVDGFTVEVPAYLLKPGRHSAKDSWPKFRKNSRTWQYKGVYSTNNQVEAAKTPETPAKGPAPTVKFTKALCGNHVVLRRLRNGGLFLAIASCANEIEAKTAIEKDVESLSGTVSTLEEVCYIALHVLEACAVRPEKMAAFQLKEATDVSLVTRPPEPN